MFSAGPSAMSTRSCLRLGHGSRVGRDSSARFGGAPPRVVSRRWRCSSAGGGDDERRRSLLRLCAERHFISPGAADAELFGRGRSCSLGPLGAELRRNLLEQWWLSVRRAGPQVFGISTLSGSGSGSGDPRADLRTVHPDSLRRIVEQPGVSREQLTRQVRELLQSSAVVRTDLLQGALEEFVPSLELVNRKLPFGLAETGPCFRPSDGPGRPAQVTEASLVWFCSPRTSSQWLDHWARQRLKWWRKFSVSPSHFGSGEVPAGRPEGGASRGVAIVYSFPWGEEPLETLRSRGDAPLLRAHGGAASGLQCQNGRKSVPHVVSVSGNVERGMMAFLSNSLQLLKKEDGKQRRLLQRKVLKLHPLLAPVKVSLDIGRGATQELRQVCDGLLQDFVDSKIWVWPGYRNTLQTSQEQLHSKYDEMGVLFSVVVSESTLESGLLHVRHRDTALKEIMHVSELNKFVCRYISAAHNI